MIFFIIVSFISGVLTILSPCVLPLLPVILTTGIDGNKNRVSGTIIGLIVSFISASLFLSWLVKISSISAQTIRYGAVVILFILGTTFVFPILLEKLQRFMEKYWIKKPITTKKKGFFSGLLTGVSLGIVWTPCIGPIVAAVATLSAIGVYSFSSVLIIVSYALGAGIFLYLLALGGSRFSKKISLFKKNQTIIRQVFGFIIIISALFIYSGTDKLFQAWTLKHLPSTWVNLPEAFEKKLNLDLSTFLSLSSTSSNNTSIKSPAVVKQIPLQNDFSYAKVKQEDLIDGCFKKDCIPSIDHPVFEKRDTADMWLSDNDVIFAIDYNGVKKAYPQKILNWHEIVNDTIDTIPVAVTFCPLCGSAISFHRKVNGVITEFGVSGKLYENDLVMYDRYEGNLWQQITGEAIVGPAVRRNEKLKQIPIITTNWKQWKTNHPDTLVLSRKTGFTRDYNKYPYGTYEENNKLFFGVKRLDKSLPIKEVVYGITVNNSSKAYPEKLFDKTEKISDTIGGETIIIKKQKDGTIAVVNTKTNETIIPIRLFWFAWASFHPDTTIYK